MDDIKMEVIKEKDCVQLLHGGTPRMTVSEVTPDMAKRVRFDPKKNLHITEWLPLNILRHFPETKKANVDEIINALRR